MGKKGRRNTVKTGDKAVSKKRLNQPSQPRKIDDPVYDEVDRFHNEKDFVSLNEASNEQASEDEVEAVMDLAVGGDDSSSQSSADASGDSSSEDEGEGAGVAVGENDEDLASSGSSDNDGILEEEEEEEINIRDWGQKKSVYYSGGDAADLENEDDAFDEEEAAKEIQRERFEKMADEDFMISDDEGDNDAGEALATGATNASRRERLKKLDKEHVELLPMLNHFSQLAKEMQSTTMVATKAIFEGEKGTAQSIGANSAGLQLLLNKAIVQTSATLNLAVYMMLKREAVAQGQDTSIIQTHPIITHMQKMDKIHTDIKALEEKHGITKQLRNVVKAAALLSGDAISDSSSDEESVDSAEEDSRSDTSEQKEVESVEEAAGASSSEDGSSDDDSSSDEEADRAQAVLTEARFGLRANEVANVESTRKRRRALMVDAGDDEQVAARAAKKSLAGTLNSIEQRTATKTRKSAQASEQIDDDTKVRRALEMMEEELGPAASDEDNDQDDSKEEAEDEDDNDFYNKVSKRSKAHREMKKKLYEVAPKFPRVEGLVEGERAASRQIIKNRGLVAHKKKINRNPRVKKKVQYQKALIRRKGAVREVRKDEAHKYGGEETGIKTNLSRSRKLA